MSEALLSLADIARLAKVRRPVVSMWRKRDIAQGQHVPFPEPAITDPAERFRATEVIDWLQRTGRGNNPDAAIEMALVRLGPKVLRDRATLLEALVTLRSLSDQPLASLGDEDLVDLADEFDPDDLAIFTEVAGGGGDLREAAHEADELCETAFGPAPALARLRRQGALELTEWGLDLMQALVWEASGVDHSGVVLAGLESSRQLAASVLGDVPEGTEVGVLVLDPSARWLHRDLLTLGVTTVSSPQGSVTRLLAIDGAAEAEVLDRVDEVQLELRPGDLGIVIGPAEILVDRLAPTLDAQRDGLLRLGALRHVVRLPEGLNSKAPRQSLALWVLAAPNRSVPLAQRRVLTSDLSSRRLDATLIDQLVGDVVAMLGSPDHLERHAVATGQIVGFPALMAGRGALVAPGARPQPLADSQVSSSRAAQVLRARAVLAALDVEPARRFGAIHVGPPALSDATRRMPGELVTVEDLLAEGNVRVIPGTRLDLDALAIGTVPVITAEDVLTHAGRAAHAANSVDPLDLARRHPRARRGEAGDIAFVTSPRPAAVVCREPGSVVAYPARTLRVQGSELVPEAVAAIINALPATDRRWHGWVFPRADHTAYDALTDLLRAIEDERGDLATRHTQLDELSHLLTGGAARGTLALTTTDTNTPTTEGDH